MIRFFQVDPDDQILMKEVYRIRYQVYCIECGFENPALYPDKMEYDEYDLCSVHFVAVNTYGIIGTVRLIFDSTLGFPIEKHCKIELNHDKPPRHQLAEVSRLAVLKQYRSQEVCLGLWREIYHKSKELGIRFLYAAMEKKLKRLFNKFHMAFEQIGEIVDYNGQRIPLLGDMEKFVKSINNNSPEIYDYFNENIHINNQEEKYFQLLRNFYISDGFFLMQNNQTGP